jgi:hypothetical protein
MPEPNCHFENTHIHKHNFAVSQNRRQKDKKKRTYINININGEGFTKGQSILVEIPMNGDRLLFNPQPYV